MRSEKEMYDLILGYAKAHDDIRAVILNGSRANPNRRPDPFNDFDIVYLVRDLQPYKTAPVHLDFGELLVYERTDENELFNEHFPEFVCYLMQFADGNRIDLTIAETARWHGYCFDDRLSVVLLDKDGALPPLPAPEARRVRCPRRLRTEPRPRRSPQGVLSFQAQSRRHPRGRPVPRPPPGKPRRRKVPPPARRLPRRAFRARRGASPVCKALSCLPAACGRLCLPNSPSESCRP